jgi:hypothetical protein
VRGCCLSLQRTTTLHHTTLKQERQAAEEAEEERVVRGIDRLVAACSSLSRGQL